MSQGLYNLHSYPHSELDYTSVTGNHGGRHGSPPVAMTLVIVVLVAFLLALAVVIVVVRVCLATCCASDIDSMQDPLDDPEDGEELSSLGEHDTSAPLLMSMQRHNADISDNEYLEEEVNTSTLDPSYFRKNGGSHVAPQYQMAKEMQPSGRNSPKPRTVTKTLVLPENTIQRLQESSPIRSYGQLDQTQHVTKSRNKHSDQQSLNYDAAMRKNYPDFSPSYETFSKGNNGTRQDSNSKLEHQSSKGTYDFVNCSFQGDQCTVKTRHGISDTHCFVEHENIHKPPQRTKGYFEQSETGTRNRKEQQTSKTLDKSRKRSNSFGKSRDTNFSQSCDSSCSCDTKFDQSNQNKRLHGSSNVHMGVESFDFSIDQSNDRIRSPDTTNQSKDRTANEIKDANKQYKTVSVREGRRDLSEIDLDDDGQYCRKEDDLYMYPYNFPHLDEVLL